MLIPSLVLFTLALLVTAICTPVVIFVAHSTGLLDHPGERRIHSRKIPRLGGIAILFSFVAGIGILGLTGFGGSSWQSLSKILGVGLVFSFVIGLWDDIRSIGSKRKLFSQFILGAILYFLGFRIETMSLGGGHYFEFGRFSLPVTMFWVAAVMNAVNLVDGMDGLATGVAAIIFVSTGLFAFFLDNPSVGIISMISAGACIGFLYFNFSPAKIFLGDSGSMSLGFLLSVLTVSISPRGAGGLPVYVPLLLLAFPFVDTSVAIMRRVIRSLDAEAAVRKSPLSRTVKAMKQVLSADGDHIHHRLLHKGLSQRQAAFILYGFTLVGAFLSFFLVMLPMPVSWLFGIATMFGIRQMVLSLEYAEFSPREVRRKEFARRLDEMLDARPVLARKV